MNEIGLSEELKASIEPTAILLAKLILERTVEIVEQSVSKKENNIITDNKSQTETLDDMKNIIKEEGLNIRIKKGESIEDLKKRIEEKRAESFPKGKAPPPVTTEELIEWANQYLDSVDHLEDKEVEEIITLFLESWSFDSGELDDNDIKFMKKAGLMSMINN